MDAARLPWRDRPADPPGPLINLALSWPGLDKVGAFDDLGGDLTVHVYCTNAEKLAKASEDLRASARRNHPEELIPTRDGEAITGQVLGTGEQGLRRLHFGYRNGFSQPMPNWDADPALAQETVPNGPKVYPRGHFIVDDWDEKAQSFPREEPWRSLVRHGSYLALAWIHQDVAAFNQFLRDNAPKVSRGRA